MTMRRRSLLLVAAMALATTISMAVPDNAGALTGSQFNPGMIISDTQFYNTTTMTASDIQSFLNLRYSGCNSGVVCLRDYHTATVTQPAQTGLCTQYTGAASESAATVFYRVSQVCGVNPEVLLVLAQKESGLLTSTNPNYKTAMGYGCPDTTGCDSKYYGFFNQVSLAAQQFKRYRLNPTNYNYLAGATNFILYNPKTSCGGSNVFIQNQATAGLYDYTPYQPNAAALANLNGTGDSCSAYGNRNFWVYFNTWFGGPTTAAFDKGGLVATRPNGTAVLFRNTGPVTGPYPTSTALGLTGMQAYVRKYSADVSGDGFADLLLVKSDSTLWLALGNNGPLAFSPPVKVGGTGWLNFNHMTVGDVENNGHPDVVATRPDGSLVLYRNTGVVTAPYALPVTIGTNFGAFNRIYAGDVNGDGYADLIATKADGTLWTFQNTHNPTAPFTTGVQRGTGWSPYFNIAATDADNDGKVDLIGTESDGSLWLFRNSGNAGAPFPTRINIGDGWSGYDAVVGIQVPAARRIEPTNLIATDPAGNLWSAANNTPPSAPFPGHAVIGLGGWSAFNRVELGDVTGDGLADVVATRPDGAMWFYPNSGSATTPYAAKTQIGTNWTAYPKFALADVNGDGKSDLVAVASDGSLRMFVNSGSATAPFPHMVTIGLGGWSKFVQFVATDVNGDGKADLLVTLTTGQLLLYLGNGSTTQPFGSPSIIGAGGWQAFTKLVAAPRIVAGHPAPADLLATSTNGSLWLYRNTGNVAAPYFGRVGAGAAGWNGLLPLSGGYVLGSGKTDLIAVNPTGTGQLWLYADQGTEMFRSPAKTGVTGMQAYDRLIVGDVSGDGRADIVATKPDGTLWLTVPSATDPAPAAVKIGLGGWQQFDRLMLADVNGDGRADLVVTKPDGTLWLYLAGTSMSAPYAIRTEIGLGGWQQYNHLTLADVNGDGRADILVTRPDGTVRVYLNTHSIAQPYGASTQVASGWAVYNRLTLGDVNHDGLADVVATKPDGTAWFCLNAGSMTTPYPGCVATTTTNWTAFDRIAL